MLDAVGIAPDVDVDGGRFGPGPACARDGDVAQREAPGIVRALPIARQRNLLEARIDCAERVLQRHVGEGDVRRAAHEHALLPLEPHGHVAAAGLRGHGRRRKQPGGDREIDGVEVGRQAPIARELAAATSVRDDERLRGEPMCSANSGGGSALASSVNTLSSRCRLPATFWKSQAILRAASRYSTRLFCTSTWMSCGRRAEACSRVAAVRPAIGSRPRCGPA